jgi:hypothetical protein
MLAQCRRANNMRTKEGKGPMAISCQLTGPRATLLSLAFGLPA